MGCAVVGIVSKDPGVNLTSQTVTGLKALQHRGEQSHGIASLTPDGKVAVRKELGLVREQFYADLEAKGLAIGHTRYLTSSTNDIRNAQPLVFQKDGLSYAISHNGNIANDSKIKKRLRLRQEGISDTYVLGELIGRSLRKPEAELVESLRENLSGVVGSYSIALLLGGKEPKIIAMRDKYGIMPLSVGENEKGFFIASESIALEYLNANHSSIRDVNPGEMITITSRGMTVDKIFDPQPQICMFQFVYMCREESVINGVGVEEARNRIGMIIGRHYKPDVDFAVAIKDAGSSYANGYSATSGIPLRNALVKDRYGTGRAFMQNEASERELLLHIKHSVVRHSIKGKKVVLIDDSSVRGDTFMEIIKIAREAGAEEVHVLLGCPPIIDQCSYGVDFYREQLIARPFREMSHTAINRMVADKLGADSLYYPTIHQLVAGIGGIPYEDLCLSCLTGRYVQNVTFGGEKERKA